MGCDIHLHIEVKIEGKWEHYGVPSIARNYSLFAVMAGVRNYNNITPIKTPCGVPNDMNIVTQIDYNRWIGDSHSASWYNTEDIGWLIAWLRTEGKDLEYDILHTYLFGNGFVPIDEERIEDVRFVFWFDN